MEKSKKRPSTNTKTFTTRLIPALALGAFLGMTILLSPPLIHCAILLAAVTEAGTVRGETPSPQPQQAVQPILQITWKLGPDLPQGLQDSEVGLLGNQLLLVGGFCQGFDDHLKPGRYPRGFLKKAWALDLDHSAKGWTLLPDFPGAARQGLFGMPASQGLYCWGGINYTAPFCHRDGYRLSHRQGKWVWEELPPLPYPLYAPGFCAMGNRIYICGGSDYDSERFYTETDRAKITQRLGAQLWVFDTEMPKPGWKRLSACPGTPRFTPAMAAVHGEIYLIGGATGDPYCTVVDNWAYDPSTDRWTRLRDLPISSGNFWGGRIVWKDRYLLLLGGFQYDKVANPDGTVRAKYGEASRLEGRGAYFNDVFVYDTSHDLFGTADSMPINNNTPMTLVRGNEVLALGGECDARQIQGRYYGHHPDLFLRGQIREINH
jgi:hypothetical protein